MEKKWFIGIDISKKTLDVVLYSDKVGTKDNNYLKISNHLAGFKKLSLWLKQKHISVCELLICMEHTGIYGLQICYYLQHLGVDYTMVCSLHLKRSLGLRRGKSDKVDAAQIARFCHLHHKELPLSVVKEESLLLIQDLMSERKRYIREQAKYKTYLSENKEIKQGSSSWNRAQESLARVEGYICEIQKEVETIISCQAELQKNYYLLCSITGIGFVNAVNTLLHTSNFHSFDSARRYACYCGVAPFEYSSGSSIRGKTRVSELSHRAIKAELSQAALCVIVHDAELKNYYKRKLKEGKEKGVVLNAIKFKLIQRMFAVVKRGTPFVRLNQFAA